MVAFPVMSFLRDNGIRTSADRRRSLRERWCFGGAKGDFVFESSRTIFLVVSMATWSIADSRGQVSDITAPDFTVAVEQVQPRMAKIFGAGGLRGLESYQSGFLISAEGHVLTAWSYVLDTDYIAVVLNDGRRLQGQLLAHDPRTEVALLKIDATGLECFTLKAAVDLEIPARVLAFSNLYGVATHNEPTSVQHGIVSAVARLNARRGTYETPYRGRVYVVDAMTNNAGAAGGALTDFQGRLAGMLGKELRSSLNNVWLNYAIPISELEPWVDAVLSGDVQTRDAISQEPLVAEPLTLDRLGITLVPRVLFKTPPFVEQIKPSSPAAAAGLREDDLILFVEDSLVQTCAELEASFKRIDRDDSVKLMVLRNQELIEMTLNER